MMNPQVRVIPPAILKIATLINFCIYQFLYYLPVCFIFVLHLLIRLHFCLYLALYIHAKEKSNNNSRT